MDIYPTEYVFISLTEVNYKEYFDSIAAYCDSKSVVGMLLLI